jgi:hypothetical protein
MLGGGVVAASASSPPPLVVGLVRRGAAPAMAGMAALWMAAPVAASAASAASASPAAEAAATAAAAAAVGGGEGLGWSWLRPASEMAAAHGRGLHSFSLELNFSNPRTHSWVKLGYTVDRRAQVELKSERV